MAGKMVLALIAASQLLPLSTPFCGFESQILSKATPPAVQSQRCITGELTDPGPPAWHSTGVDFLAEAARLLRRHAEEIFELAEGGYPKALKTRVP